MLHMHEIMCFYIAVPYHMPQAYRLHSRACRGCLEASSSTPHPSWMPGGTVDQLLHHTPSRPQAPHLDRLARSYRIVRAQRLTIFFVFSRNVPAV